MDDFSKANTGVAATVLQLTAWQIKHVEWVGIFTAGLVDILIPKGVEVMVWPVHSWLPAWRYPTQGLRNLLRVIRDNKVTHIHVHGIWQAGFVLGMLSSDICGLPVVLSMHGMCAPIALKHGGWFRRLKKRGYWSLLTGCFMRSRVGLHAVTELEAQYIREFTGRNASVILPNAIDLTDATFHQPYPKTRLLRRIVYLGRLHPIKGPDLLIQAFSDSELWVGWELVLAGPEEIPDYARELKALAVASKKSSQIRFIGPSYGPAKKELLASAWVVVVPSHSEVVGMVNLEAASLCTPTITTHSTGLVNWQAGGGVLSAATADGLRMALNAAMLWSVEERRDRGRRARYMIEQEFSLESVGVAWLRFYRDLDRPVNRNGFGRRLLTSITRDITGVHE